MPRNTMRLILHVPDGRGGDEAVGVKEYVFQAATTGDVWDWVTKINYAAAMRTVGTVLRVPAAATAPAPQARAHWDRCLSNFLVKAGAATSVGIVTSVLLFRKKTWPVALAAGFGLGVAYEQCQRSFDPNVTLNAVRVPKQA
ncbi:hypothetical protein AMAG_20042 [Allomyces macrogynus ATCC 38327]|uniref:MICOS complex subunit MIC10 n=1 Tax=Allomyces macrogynus (strain ATCC 38327) TaxID=578462 RepID=A0A0L0T4V8_ALLM3|nr:hypothetical protein AMAG_20042 [Allomyces macrogynus ATCC 38327]|eukprot:KNE69777.1 hypothetical protein AMAG_20042 [Allomyces macrogynus ATCC 38327]